VFPQLHDLIGIRFSRLVVEKRITNDKHGTTRWKCRCDCGKKKDALASMLKLGKTRSCGCLTREECDQRRAARRARQEAERAARKAAHGPSRLLHDLTGQRFGRLVVESQAATLNRNARWNCCCDCGKTCVSLALNLKQITKEGGTPSCGCVQEERIGAMHEAHLLRRLGRLKARWAGKYDDATLQARLVEAEEQIRQGQGLATLLRRSLHPPEWTVMHAARGRPPWFVAKMTGFTKKHDILSRYGDGARFVWGKPPPPRLKHISPRRLAPKKSESPVKHMVYVDAAYLADLMLRAAKA
jgi:hypothetical protein